MREIKFRAWDDYAKEMYYSEEADIKRACGFIIETDSGYENSDFVWMQYAGLKDKNGVEIYEGDVVCNQYEAIRTVERTKYGEYRLFCGKNHSHFIKGWKKGIEWEVVGNIHQHKNLLGSNS